MFCPETNESELKCTETLVNVTHRHVILLMHCSLCARHKNTFGPKKKNEYCMPHTKNMPATIETKKKCTKRLYFYTAVYRHRQKTVTQPARIRRLKISIDDTRGCCLTTAVLESGFSASGFSRNSCYPGSLKRQRPSSTVSRRRCRQMKSKYAGFDDGSWSYRQLLLRKAASRGSSHLFQLVHPSRLPLGETLHVPFLDGLLHHLVDDDVLHRHLLYRLDRQGGSSPCVRHIKPAFP